MSNWLSYCLGCQLVSTLSGSQLDDHTCIKRDCIKEHPGKTVNITERISAMAKINILMEIEYIILSWSRNTSQFKKVTNDLSLRLLKIVRYKLMWFTFPRNNVLMFVNRYIVSCTSGMKVYSLPHVSTHDWNSDPVRMEFAGTKKMWWQKRKYQMIRERSERWFILEYCFDLNLSHLKQAAN